MGVQSMGPNLLVISWIGYYHLLLTRKSKQEFLSWIFLQNTFFHSRAILSGAKRGRYHTLKALTTIPFPTLQSYFRLGYKPFPEPFHLCTFSQAISFPLPTCGSFPYPFILKHLNSFHPPDSSPMSPPPWRYRFPNPQASCYLSFLWSWVLSLSRSLCLISPSRP